MPKKLRCLSCRKLKIACDHGEPKCEYCAATGRKCIYPEPKKRTKKNSKITKSAVTVYDPSSSKSDNTPLSEDKDVQYLLELTSDSISDSSGPRSDKDIIEVSDLVPVLYDNRDLNTNHKQLGITKFEYRLLFTFQVVYVRNFSTPNFDLSACNPVEKIWVLETPNLWHSSPAMRQCIYTMSTMFLNDSVNLPVLIQSDIVSNGSNLTVDSPGFDLIPASTVERWSNGAVDNIPLNLNKNMIKDKVLHHFGDAITENTTLIAKLSKKTKLKFEEAAEIVLSSILLFSFLTTQPYNIVSLINFNGSETDLIRIVQGMGQACFEAVPMVYQSKFHGVLYYTEFEDKPHIPDEYPIIAILNKQFNDKYKWRYDKQVAAALESSIGLFNICLFKSMKANDADHIFRWIFFNDPVVFDLMESKDYFSLKLLFYYSCLVLITGTLAKRYDNVFIEFLVWFKEYSFPMFDGSWELEFDYHLYNLVLRNFRLTSVSCLRDFNPENFNLY